MTIEDYLLGLWTNQNQAQSSPTTYATIFMEWKEIEGGFSHKITTELMDPVDPIAKGITRKSIYLRQKY